jgi:hypothetical protein
MNRGAHREFSSRSVEGNTAPMASNIATPSPDLSLRERNLTGGAHLFAHDPSPWTPPALHGRGYVIPANELDFLT